MIQLLALFQHVQLILIVLFVVGVFNNLLILIKILILIIFIIIVLMMDLLLKITVDAFLNTGLYNLVND